MRRPTKAGRFRLTTLLLAVAAAGGTAAAEPPRPPTGEKRYLYVGRAAKDRDGFRDLAPSIEVHDIDDGHKLVKVIPLPKNVYALRGICASAATKRLYIAHYGQFKGKTSATGYSAPGGGRLLCLDLATNAVLWEKAYPPSADRMAITPDGTKLYFPAGEERDEDFWVVIDARTGDVLTRVPHTSKPHNTIVSLDGKLAFLQAFGTTSQRIRDTRTNQPVPDENPGDDRTHENGFLSASDRMLAVVDTRSDKVIRRVGPFRECVRPFTINGRGTLVFVTVNDLIGFQVGDVQSGRVLFTAEPPDGTPLDGGRAFRQPPSTDNRIASHGIALTADEKQVYVVDQKHVGLHVFDVSGLPEKPPVWKRFLKTRTGRPDIFGQPGWIMSTIDGRYFYPETCEIVDTRAGKIVGQLVGGDGKPTHSRFALEVVMRNGVPVRVGDQFGVGRVR
uniref:Uncharacterized protein n=1 Tax=uncultured Armatimonadetes bacterium TaxID=157466 RepID=A0A6J4JVT0_9BACT|nr:hypothetical protein AVDCRST_MAG63-4194 [uncultured Armatimonadetes bacterium]